MRRMNNSEISWLSKILRRKISSDLILGSYWSRKYKTVAFILARISALSIISGTMFLNFERAEELNFSKADTWVFLESLRSFSAFSSLLLVSSSSALNFKCSCSVISDLNFWRSFYASCLRCSWTKSKIISFVDGVVMLATIVVCSM